MRIERKIAKDSWKVNLPSEMMTELGWEKGDEIIFELSDEKIIISNKHKRQKIEKPEDNSKRYSNGKKIPLKKTPCEFYEFTKQKYVDNKCKKCNPQELFFQEGITCPLLENNTKEVVKEIAKNLDNERKIDEQDKELIESKLELKNSELQEKIKKLKRLEDRYDRLSKTKISFLSSLDPEQQDDYLKQVKCGSCKQPMIKKSSIIKNNSLICESCRDTVISEIRETVYLGKEINKLRREINGRHRDSREIKNS